MLRRCRGMLETGARLVWTATSLVSFGMGVGLGARLLHSVAHSMLVLFASETWWRLDKEQGMQPRKPRWISSSSGLDIVIVEKKGML